MGNDISRQKADGVGARRFEGIIKAFFAASYEGIDEGVAFLEHLRERHGGRLNVIRDNAPAHRGEALRSTSGPLIWGCRWRICRATARTSMPMRPSGTGRGRRPSAICAWTAGLRCSSGSADSWPGCPAGKRRSNGAAIKGEALMQDSQPDPRCPANAHPALALGGMHQLSCSQELNLFFRTPAHGFGADAPH